VDGQRSTAQDDPVLTGTPQPDGGLVLILILILLAMLLAAVATVALGCLWAWKAGRGSQLGLCGWVVCAALEAFVLLFAVGGSSLASPTSCSSHLPLPLQLRVALYLRARGGKRAVP